MKLAVKSVPQVYGHSIKQFTACIWRFAFGVALTPQMPPLENWRRYIWAGRHGYRFAPHYQLRILWLMFGFRLLEKGQP